MKKLTQGEMQGIVNNNPKMFEEYQKRVCESDLKYSRQNCKIGNKKVGIAKFVNKQKEIAASVYRDMINDKSIQQPSKSGTQW